MSTLISISTLSKAAENPPSEFAAHQIRSLPIKIVSLHNQVQLPLAWSAGRLPFMRTCRSGVLDNECSDIQLDPRAQSLPKLLLHDRRISGLSWLSRVARERCSHSQARPAAVLLGASVR